MPEINCANGTQLSSIINDCEPWQVPAVPDDLFDDFVENVPTFGFDISMKMPMTDSQLSFAQSFLNGDNGGGGLLDDLINGGGGGFNDLFGRRKSQLNPVDLLLSEVVNMFSNSQNLTLVGSKLLNLSREFDLNNQVTENAKIVINNLIQSDIADVIETIDSLQLEILVIINSHRATIENLLPGLNIDSLVQNFGMPEWSISDIQSFVFSDEFVESDCNGVVYNAQFSKCCANGMIWGIMFDCPIDGLPDFGMNDFQ